MLTDESQCVAAWFGYLVVNAEPGGSDPDALRPDGLGPRAAALWDGMTAAGQPPWRAVLLGEACRLTERLDRLAALLNGDAYSWLRLELDELDEVYDLRVDAAVAEARQTTGALRLVLALLTPVSQGQRSAQPPSVDNPPDPQPGGSLADEVARRRAGREARA